MSISASLIFGATVTETLSSGVPAVTSPNLVHDAYNELVTLNATSTPPGTQVSNFLLTLTAGAATINLAALTGANTTIDGTGLRVQLIRIKNLGSNSMAFSNGASNGIALACGTITVPAGGITQIYLNDASPDIAAADRTIDVAGTLVETAEVTIILG
jgi:hypothetical protein